MKLTSDSLEPPERPIPERYAFGKADPRDPHRLSPAT